MACRSASCWAARSSRIFLNFSSQATMRAAASPGATGLSEAGTPYASLRKRGSLLLDQWRRPPWLYAPMISGTSRGPHCLMTNRSPSSWPGMSSASEQFSYFGESPKQWYPTNVWPFVTLSRPSWIALSSDCDPTLQINWRLAMSSGPFSYTKSILSRSLSKVCLRNAEPGRAAAMFVARTLLLTRASAAPDGRSSNTRSYVPKARTTPAKPGGDSQILASW